MAKKILRYIFIPLVSVQVKVGNGCFPKRLRRSKFYFRASKEKREKKLGGGYAKCHRKFSRLQALLRYLGEVKNAM